MDYLNIPLKANDGKTYALKDFNGSKVILYFYPKDDTSGCTLEARDFTQLKDDFEKKGYTIIGVSKDSVKSHQDFCEKHDLSILLLSDPNQELIKAFDVLGEKSMYGKTFMGILRSTFILDENGTIIKEMRNVKSTGHAQNVLDLL